MSKLGWILVFASAACTVAANLLMRAGLDRFGGFPAGIRMILPTLFKLALQPMFFSGVLFYGVAAIIWFRVIASEPLTVAYPVLVSTTFLLVSLGAVWWFGEIMSPRKLGGMACMLLGIALISKG